jgi:hypothetical protein
MNKSIIKNLIFLGIFILSLILVNSVSAFTCTGYGCTHTYDSPTNYNNYHNYDYGYGHLQPQNNLYNNQVPPSGYGSYSNYSNNHNVYYANQNPNPTYKPSPSVVNNYYYPTTYTTPKVATATNNTTTSTVKTTEKVIDNKENNNNTTNTSNSNSDYNNYLGASAYNSSYQTPDNRITALTLRGSGSFMPSSIWQWIFVIILILAIIIIARMLSRKNHEEETNNTLPHVH